MIETSEKLLMVTKCLHSSINISKNNQDRIMKQTLADRRRFRIFVRFFINFYDDFKHSFRVIETREKLQSVYIQVLIIKKVIKIEL